MSDKKFNIRSLCDIEDGEVVYVAKYAFTISSENLEDNDMRINISHPCTTRRKRSFSVRVKRNKDKFEISYFDTLRVAFSKEFQREAASIMDVARLFGAISGGDNELRVVVPASTWRIK